MKEITAAMAAEITGGTLLCGDGDTVITNIQYDSRSVCSGTLFVPLRGEKVDAHRFIPQCFESGAAATLTENDTLVDQQKPHIRVDDTLRALQKLAAWHRGQFPGLKVVGVTGSVGKTSTKEMIAAALSGGINVMKTQGNKNSQIGLSSTMFDIQPENMAAVIEMGVSEPGEMDRLSNIAVPSMAVMTNIGKAHIENLKTQENIMAEKLKITSHFDSNGILFVNGDDRLLSTLVGKLPFHTVSFGLGECNDYHAENITTEGLKTSFDCISSGRSRRFTIPALGVHSVSNALVAIAVGEAMGLSSEQIAEGLSRYRNAPMRQQIIQLDDLTVIDDSYNASPEAAKVSLDVLKSIAKGKTIAVLADMLELGEEGPGEHYGVGKHLAQIGVDCLIAVGELSENTSRGAEENGCSCVMKCRDNKTAYELLTTILEKNTTVLIKGSRGMHTDEIVILLSQSAGSKLPAP